ncbi:MAG: hypothetical protein IJR48_09870, partial [Oscillibacter sp.]|nr:hypothetical protein [Oscillibacter sp.]
QSKITALTIFQKRTRGHTPLLSTPSRESPPMKPRQFPLSELENRKKDSNGLAKEHRNWV